MMKAATKILDFFLDISGIVLVFLVAVTLIDIFTRHLGIFDLRGIVEIAILAVVTIGFLALPSSFVRGGHIIIDLVTSRLPAHTKKIIDSIWLVTATIAFGFISYFMWISTIEAGKSGQYTIDLHIPTLYLWIPASIGMSLTPVGTLVALLNMVRPSQNTQDVFRPASEFNSNGR